VTRFADRQEGNRQAEASPPLSPIESADGADKKRRWRMSAFLIELQNSFLFLSRTEEV